MRTSASKKATGPRANFTYAGTFELWHSFFLKVSISLLKVHIWSCMLSTFSIRIFQIITIGILNSLIIPTSFSYPTVVLMIALSLLGFFFLKYACNYWNPDLLGRTICAEMNMFFRLFIYLFSERGEGREKERETNNQCVVTSYAPPTGDLACNLGMCPYWELNWWPFGGLPIHWATSARAELNIF